VEQINSRRDIEIKAVTVRTLDIRKKEERTDTIREHLHFHP